MQDNGTSGRLRRSRTAILAGAGATALVLPGFAAAQDAGATIMITVSAVSEHGQLVQALNLCAKNGLKSLSVVSASN